MLSGPHRTWDWLSHAIIHLSSLCLPEGKNLRAHGHTLTLLLHDLDPRKLIIDIITTHISAFIIAKYGLYKSLYVLIDTVRYVTLYR